MNHLVIEKRKEKGHPIAWYYEVAQCYSMVTREFSHYRAEVSLEEPGLKEPALRNLTPLYALTPVQLHTLHNAMPEAAESDSEDHAEADSQLDLNLTSGEAP